MEGSNGSRFIATGTPLIVAVVVVLALTAVSVAILLLIATRSGGRTAGTLSRKGGSTRSARSKPSMSRLERGHEEDEDVDEIMIQPPVPRKSTDDRVVVLEG